MQGLWLFNELFMMDEPDVSSLHTWYLSEKEALENFRVKINAVMEAFVDEIMREINFNA